MGVLLNALSGKYSGSLLLSESSNGLCRKTHFYAVDVLGLQVNLELAFRGDIGMTAGVAGTSTAAGHLANSGHKIEALINRDILRIIRAVSGQEKPKR